MEIKDYTFKHNRVEEHLYTCPESYNVVHLKDKYCAGHSIHVLVYFASKNISPTFTVTHLAEKYKITA